MIGKRVIISGINGMLGSCLADFLSGNTVIGLDRNTDITNSSKVEEFINEINPDIIIHAAAFTNVDACENEIDKAYKVNVIGTQNIVNACLDRNLLFIYISSTGIYGDYKDEVYTEFDKVVPTTIHHKTKYEGEKVVENHLTKYLILRTGWLYGGNKEHNKNFVYKRYLESLQNKVMFSDNSQMGNPTYVLDFCKQIMLLIDKNQLGTFNCVNFAEKVTRYDYVSQIIEYFGTDCQVKIAPPGSYSRLAQVSKNESARNFKLDLLEINIMRDWKIALAEYINELKN